MSFSENDAFEFVGFFRFGIFPFFTVANDPTLRSNRIGIDFFFLLFLCDGLGFVLWSGIGLTRLSGKSWFELFGLFGLFGNQINKRNGNGLTKLWPRSCH